MPGVNRGDAMMALNPIAWLRRELRGWGVEHFCRRYYGIYPAIVVDNKDPEGLFRIRPLCRAIGISRPEAVPENYWAFPCLPGLGNDAAGASSGDVWVPDEGSNVWIQFEHGDPAHPVYMGGFVNRRKDMPELDHEAALRKGVRTRSGHFLRFSDDGDDLHITLAKGDGAGSQTASFLTFDKDGGVALSNDKGSLLYLNAQDDQVSLMVANEDQETEALCMLGLDEITLATKGGASLGIKGENVTINGEKLILNGQMVHLATKQLYLGKDAKEPAVRGNKLMQAHALHTHGSGMPGSPTTPPAPPPLTLGNELSTSVFIE